jgi:polysaccharide chain length determinant protein (PEP-CTERM system associated)
MHIPHIPGIDGLMLTLRDMWAKRWLGLAAAWIVALAGVAAVSRVPDRWEAAARIYVDTQSIIKPLLQGLTVQPDIDQMVSMLARTLISRPNVERLVANANLDTGMSAEERERLIQSLIAQIKVVNTTGGRGNNLYDISYRDVDAARARRVVAELVALFVASGQGEKREDTAEARKFIDEQIALYEAKLEEAENRLKDFKLRNFAVAGGGAPGQDYFARMSAIQQELGTVEVDLRAAEQSRDALRRQLAQEQAELPTQRSSRLADIDARINAQRIQLDELLRRDTDEHPDVVAAKRMIDQLQLERTQVAAQQAGGTLPLGPKENSAYEQIRVRLADAEANVASLHGRLAQMRARLQELQDSATKVPKVEAELAQLNRDYEVMRKNYEQLVQRRESAAISGDQDASAGLANFRVIEPPHVDPHPVFPSRAVLIASILLLSLAAGTGLCFALVRTFPTLRSLRELGALSGRAVLGSISLRTDSVAMAQERRWNVLFAPALGLLVAAYAVWAVYVALH